jgi:alkane 1-monooxygenase
MKSLKYLLVFSLPITVSIAFRSEGWLSYLPVYIFFILVPFLELILPSHWTTNEASENAMHRHAKYYNYLLYVLVFVQWCFVAYFLIAQSTSPDATTWWGRVVSMGLMCGIIGINVGHELGHRNKRSEQFLGELLLLSSLENHFLPYHNRGHHTNVGTPSDPATARKNEPVYIFWFRSQIGSYFQAWQIELTRMQIIGKDKYSFHNKMDATLCYCNYGSQSLRKIRSTLWRIPIFLRQLQSLFLMRHKAQHGLRITQIILRILTALQAIPNHRVNVVKCISLIHFVLQMNAL